MPSFRRALRPAGAVFAALLVLAACGDDDSTDNSAAAPSSAPTTAGESPSPGEPVSATAEPIKIGFRNIDSAVPDVSTGFLAGIDYVNEVLGGVNGRPLEVVTCTVDGTPEGSIDCANQLVEAGVVLSVQGADPAADGAIPVLIEAGIAETGITALGPVQQADVGHSFMFATPGDVAGIASVVAMEDAGAENIRFFLGDSPRARDFEARVAEAAEDIGVTAEVIFHAVGAADWPSLVASALSQDADAIGVPIASEADCTAMVSAAVQAGFDGPILAGNCREFVEAVGAEQTTNVYTYGNLIPADLVESAPEDDADEIRIFIERMEAAGEGDKISGFAVPAFGMAVTLVDVLTQIEESQGDLTAESILAGFPDVSGEKFMGGPYKCDGTAWRGTSNCEAAVVVMKQNADGTRAIAGDGFIDLSPFQPK